MAGEDAVEFFRDCRYNAIANNHLGIIFRPDDGLSAATTTSSTGIRFFTYRERTLTVVPTKAKRPPKRTFTSDDPAWSDASNYCFEMDYARWRGRKTFRFLFR